MLGEKKRHILVTFQLIFVVAIIFAFLLFFKPNLVGFTIFQSQPDEASSNDTYIKQSLDTNYGEDTVLKIGKTSSGEDLRSLLQFDISSIPSDYTILSAVLELYSSTIPIKNITLKAYRITTSWNELETGWNNAASLQPWSTAGADYEELASQIEILNDSSRWYNLTITNLVRGWVNSSYSNFGLILIASDATSGNYTYLDSSSGTNSPILTIDYTANAPPLINSISTDSSLSNPKQIGQQVTFTINWNDLENNNAKAYVCNSTNISTSSGCGDKTYCSTSFALTNPITCSYTITSSENRTTNFSFAVCDLTNCSTINQSFFYVNHLPNITITNPNGGESINQVQGNYKIRFNVTDSDKDKLSANLYYGETSGSTAYLINSGLNLTNACLDADSDTSSANNCSYSWDTTGVYGNYYLTIIINDSFSVSNDSSNAVFTVDSLTDDEAPNITAQWVDTDVFSGKSTQFYANVSDQYIKAVWASINSSSGQINLTMRNITALTYNVSWIATAIGNYQYKVYANDTKGNLNSSMPWASFNIRKPVATAQNSQYPSTSLPYSTIRISGELNSTDSLRDISANLITPDGFSFLSGYNQNFYIGNFSANQTKNISWYVSVPITESTYSLSINYSDSYSNIWNSSVFSIQVTSAVGGGYLLTMEGYPYVSRGENYTAKAYFTQSGNYVQPDSITITMTDPTASKLSDHPALMSNLSVGIFNYTRKIDTTWLEGQWETTVNATKSGVSYYAFQFWRVVGTLFDIRNITIINPSTKSLLINFILENKGTKSEDMNILYNLTKETGEPLGTYAETIGVNAGEIKTVALNGKSNPSNGVDTKGYVGSAKITIIGSYPGGKIGAYQIFSLTSGVEICGDSTCNGGETCSSCPGDCGTCPGGNVGGGGGGSVVSEKANFSLTADSEITLTKNIEKTFIARIKNTGTKKLADVTLALESLDSIYYTITPEKASINAGEEAEFKIKFLINDFIGEKDFYYVVKSSQDTLKQQAKIIVLSMRDYFLQEVAKLQSRLDKLQGNNNVKAKIPDCELILNQTRTSIDKEEFINAESNIKEAESCVSSLEEKAKLPTAISIKWSDYWVWIVTWLLIIILILVLIAIVYIIYRKYQVIDLLKQGQSSAKEAKKDDFKDKIKKIEDELGK
ncbi:MAG: DNRLRE domain-containing protein [Candidatus Pacearchaeota archaeon]|nr:DNRLRE domain-containing protein [Candidatus Pacearchaeota archaeon]